MPQAPAPDGKIRYTVILTKESHKRLAEITEKFNINQADAIETLLSNSTGHQWDQLFAKARVEKAQNRTKRRQLLQELAGMNPEDLARIVAAAKTKTPA